MFQVKIRYFVALATKHVKMGEGRGLYDCFQPVLIMFEKVAAFNILVSTQRTVGDLECQNFNHSKSLKKKYIFFHCFPALQKKPTQDFILICNMNDTFVSLIKF
jgi:hypothetical protein